MHQENRKEAIQIAVAMVAGLVVGMILYMTGYGHFSEYLRYISTIFLGLLKMVIVPLVFSSIFMAMYHLGTPEALGKMGRKAVGYYFATTCMAVFIGIIMVNLIQPGVGADLGKQGLEELGHMKGAIEGNKGLIHTILGVLIGAIPVNPFKALADGNVLQLIVFAILIGMTSLFMKTKAKPFVDFMGSLEALSLKLTHVVMKLAPLGIFALTVDILAKTGMSAILSLSKYFLAVVLGLLIHAIVLLMIASYRTKKSPIFILKGLSAPLITAFSTSSSAATLPVTMTAVEENLGVRKDTAKFVLPLGATVNMDGTALYESIAAIFIAQAYGISLGLDKQLIIFLTASLAAVGAAAIPGAGLITMGIVLNAVGLPLEGIGLILAVDRLLDMFRTTVNVFGDCVGTIFVDSMMKDSDFSLED